MINIRIQSPVLLLRQSVSLTYSLCFHDSRKQTVLTFLLIIYIIVLLAELAVEVEYANCISAER